MSVLSDKGVYQVACGKNFTAALDGEGKVYTWTKSGDALAQFNLGCLYRDGLHVDTDENRAVVFFTLAAEQGFANAQYGLGCMTRDGVQEK